MNFSNFFLFFTDNFFFHHWLLIFFFFLLFLCLYFLFLFFKNGFSRVILLPFLHLHFLLSFCPLFSIALFRLLFFSLLLLLFWFFWNIFLTFHFIVKRIGSFSLNWSIFERGSFRNLSWRGFFMFLSLSY